MFDEGSPKLPSWTIVATATLITANCPTPSAPSQRATIIPATTLLKIINTRVANVQDACIHRLRRFNLCNLWILSVDPAFIPEAQIQQRPKMKSPVFRFPPVLVQHPADKVVVQQIAAPHP